MPTAIIPNIGEVEYTRTSLPSGIKGKTYIGELTAPILISEDLGPSAKLDYVVAHEVGHRLTLDMIANAYDDAPSFFQGDTDPLTGFIRYLISLGLSRSTLSPLHPATKASLNAIFDTIARGENLDPDAAKELIAEVYAGWATNRGATPPAIATRFASLTKSKNFILKTKSLVNEQAAFLDNSKQEEWLVTGALVLVAILIVKAL